MRVMASHTKRQCWRNWRYLPALMGVLVLLAVGVWLAGGARHSTAYAQGNYQPTYLMNQGRNGFNGGETAINPSTAPTLQLQWTHQAAGAVNSQVVQANGLLYWGSWDGYEHASLPSDGTDVWKTYLGITTKKYCLPLESGVASTATIASMTINGTLTPVDYVGGGNNTFYALNARTGSIIWQYSFSTPPGQKIWDSPFVLGGSVYIGVSSYGDCPLTPGFLVELDGATGAVQASLRLTPTGCNGAGIWGSPTLDKTAGMIYIATGTIVKKCPTYEQYATALVKVRASDLSVVDSWQVPAPQAIADGDFGCTPTLFQATINGVTHGMVGVLNKNGIYYAFDRTNLSAGPLWQVRLAVPPRQNPVAHQPNIASSSWDGNNLYAAGALTTINGTSCPGSVRALDPATGQFRWQVCLTGNVFSPVVSVPGLVVVGAGQFMSVLDSTSGNLLYQFQDPNSTSSFWDWGTASVINGVLYDGNADGNLYAFAPASTP